MSKQCKHNRIERIYHHGRNSAYKIKCKDCKKILTRKDLEQW